MPIVLSFNAGKVEDRKYPDQVERTAIGKLPIVGFLFRRDEVTDESRELLIFITPRIIA